MKKLITLFAIIAALSTNAQTTTGKAEGKEKKPPTFAVYVTAGTEAATALKDICKKFQPVDIDVKQINKAPTIIYRFKKIDKMPITLQLLDNDKGNILADSDAIKKHIAEGKKPTGK